MAVAQRRYAELNDRAIARKPLTLEQYLQAPFIARPYRAADCTAEVDGACAVLVTSLERARDLRHPPAVIRSAAWSGGPRPGLDIGDHVLYDDYTRNYTHHLRHELFGRAGVTVDDIDVAEIYDCFTSTVAHGLGRARVLRPRRVGRLRALRGNRAGRFCCRPTRTADCSPRATFTA